VNLKLVLKRPYELAVSFCVLTILRYLSIFVAPLCVLDTHFGFCLGVCTEMNQTKTFLYCSFLLQLPLISYKAQWSLYVPPV